MPHFQTNKGDGEHILDATPTRVEARELTEAEQAAEDKRLADAPVVGPVAGMPKAHNDGGPYEHRPLAAAKGEVDPATLNRFEPPRHDAYAAENSGYVAERVIPGGPTNAHPDFSVAGPGGLTTTATINAAGGVEVRQVDDPDKVPPGGEPVMPPAAPLVNEQVAEDGSETPVPSQVVDAEAVITAGEPNPPSAEPANEIEVPAPAAGGIEETNPAAIPAAPASPATPPEQG